MNNENADLLKMKWNAGSQMQWWKPKDGKYSQFMTLIAQNDISWENFPRIEMMNLLSESEVGQNHSSSKHQLYSICIPYLTTALAAL